MTPITEPKASPGRRLPIMDDWERGWRKLVLPSPPSADRAWLFAVCQWLCESA
jgi:hypothetical protein